MKKNAKINYNYTIMTNFCSTCLPGMKCRLQRNQAHFSVGSIISCYINHQKGNKKLTFSVITAI